MNSLQRLEKHLALIRAHFKQRLCLLILRERDLRSFSSEITEYVFELSFQANHSASERFLKLLISLLVTIAKRNWE